MTKDEYEQAAAHLLGLAYMRWWFNDALGDPRLVGLSDAVRGAYPWILSVAAASPIPGALVDFEKRALPPPLVAHMSGVTPKTTATFLGVARSRGIAEPFDDDPALYFPAYLKRQVSAEERARGQARSDRARAASLKRWQAEEARKRQLNLNGAVAHANA